MLAMYFSLNREKALARLFTLAASHFMCTIMLFATDISIILQNMWLKKLLNSFNPRLVKAVVMSM